MEKLLYTQLKNFDLYEEGNFENIEPKTDIIGQERAKKALDFGLKIKASGYNIYVSGEVGVGKSSFAEKFAKEQAKSEPVPDDLCYVYSFENPKFPELIKLPAGLGKEFKKDMEELIDHLTVGLPKAFASTDFEESKNLVISSFSTKRDILIKHISEEAKKQNFGVKTTSTGIYFMPIVDGKMISEEQYNELEESEKEEILKNSSKMQDGVASLMGKMKDFENKTKKEIDSLEYATVLFTLGRYMDDLFEKYKDNESVGKYLLTVKEDILDNAEDFLDDGAADSEEEMLQAMFPWSQRKDTSESFLKYKVNLLVDNSKLKGAPVIVDFNPTYSNLVGDVEYDTEHGNFVTDFMKIKSGLLHKANGGYLILRSNDILSSIYAWEALTRTLVTKEFAIEPIREFQTVAINAIRPEKLTDVNIKVILVGSHYFYGLLHHFDDDFTKLFKIHAEFDYEMSLSHTKDFLGFVKNFEQSKEGIKLTADAVSKVLEYSTRLASRKDKLTTNFNAITEILEESVAWAGIEGTTEVTKDIINKAITEKEHRVNLYEEKLGDMIDQDLILIDTSGEKVGQINGLAVIDTGDHTFAKPSKITATTYAGTSGIINVEKESKLSGKIHDKGVQVLSGYLGQKYAKETPFSISCRICFEQNYSGVDGDSASSTELYAILSSIADLPINQGLAVTGSMNQYGEVQPIGGVTPKIEGFYDVCKNRGLTGKQGVIIPVQNVIDLVLKDEVIEAVKEGKFNIYSVTHVDEGLELLTGVKPKEFHKIIGDKLKKYAEKGKKGKKDNE